MTPFLYLKQSITFQTLHLDNLHGFFSPSWVVQYIAVSLAKRLVETIWDWGRPGSAVTIWQWEQGTGDQESSFSYILYLGQTLVNTLNCTTLLCNVILYFCSSLHCTALFPSMHSGVDVSAQAHRAVNLIWCVLWFMVVDCGLLVSIRKVSYGLYCLLSTV